ncbi:hypothetical protein J7E83_02995 [Arthrobacter sp. ISL-48]|uniref:hypothetical protein n=1 Tax=Arthrobacter sp. ISL-48 TaxID=2819110 RepID=UPI001BEBE553|nr:hypothetical protein [Arthrobacter sp. ISL-48]MBT2531105.1 hypothetical protein [Arthrobacter sp. ISL-48]
MGEIYPQEFDQLLNVISAQERGRNIARAVHTMLRSSEPAVRDAAALAWCFWEDRLSTPSGPIVPRRSAQDPLARLGFSRIVTHYFANAAFQADDAITSRLDRIAHIPAYFVRGRLDIASPLRSAYEIAQQLPHSTLDIVEADAHSGGDDTLGRLVAIMDRLGASN